MSGWNDPRFVITLLLIGLFGFAYVQDPADDSMKGAIIAAFSTAYGFWLASKDKEKSTENTGKALDAIRAAQETPMAQATPTSDALRSGDTVTLTDTGGPEKPPETEDDTGNARPFN